MNSIYNDDMKLANGHAKKESETGMTTRSEEKNTQNRHYMGKVDEKK